MNSSYIRKGTSCPRFTVSVADHRSTGRDTQKTVLHRLAPLFPVSTGRQFQACLLSLCCSEINMASSKPRSSRPGSPAFLTVNTLRTPHLGKQGFSSEEGRCGYPYCRVVLPKSQRKTKQCGHRSEVNPVPGLCHLHSFSQSGYSS